jgi:hypothetical protein
MKGDAMHELCERISQVCKHDTSITEVYRMFDDVIESWFKLHGENLSGHHYIMAGPAKFSTEKGRRFYRRTARLMLSREQAAMPMDKVLIEDVIQFAMEWADEKK